MNLQRTHCPLVWMMVISHPSPWFSLHSSSGQWLRGTMNLGVGGVGCWSGGGGVAVSPPLLGASAAGGGVSSLPPPLLGSGAKPGVKSSAGSADAASSPVRSAMSRALLSTALSDSTALSVANGMRALGIFLVGPYSVNDPILIHSARTQQQKR